MGDDPMLTQAERGRKKVRCGFDRVKRATITKHREGKLGDDIIDSVRVYLKKDIYLE